MPRVREHKFEAFAEDTLGRYRGQRPQLLAVDTETTGLTWQDTPFGLSVSWSGPYGVESGWFELEEQKPMELGWLLLREHAENGGVFIFFNAKFDIRMLTNFGMWSAYEGWKYVDVMPAVALLEPTGEHKLKVAARKYLGVSTYQDAQIKLARRELNLKRDDGYWPLPREVVVPYAMKDTEYTLRLHDKLMPMISARGLDVAFGKEMRIVAEFLRMEMRGLKVKPEVVKDSIKESDGIISRAQARIEELVGRKVGKAKSKVKVPNGASEKTGRELFKTIEVPLDFNVDAWQQVMSVFEDRGIKLKSTESKVLQRIDDPLVEPLLTYRTEKKLRDTYLVNLLKEMDENHIVHPNLNSNGTATGRASSGAVRET